MPAFKKQVVRHRPSFLLSSSMLVILSTALLQMVPAASAGCCCTNLDGNGNTIAASKKGGSDCNDKNGCYAVGNECGQLKGGGKSKNACTTFGGAVCTTTSTRTTITTTETTTVTTKTTTTTPRPCWHASYAGNDPCTTTLTSTTLTSTTITTTITITSTTTATTTTTTTITATTTTTTTTATATTTTIYNELNVDCLEGWDKCTAACQTASQRNYWVTRLHEHEGRACRGAPDCEHGDDDCLSTSTTVTTITTTTVTTVTTVTKTSTTITSTTITSTTKTATTTTESTTTTTTTTDPNAVNAAASKDTGGNAGMAIGIVFALLAVGVIGFLVYRQKHKEDDMYDHAVASATSNFTINFKSMGGGLTGAPPPTSNLTMNPSLAEAKKQAQQKRASTKPATNAVAAGIYSGDTPDNSDDDEANGMYADATPVPPQAKKSGGSKKPTAEERAKLQQHATLSNKTYTPSGGAAAPIAPIEEDEDLYLAPTEPPPRPSLEVAAPAAEDEDLYLAPAATPVVNEGMYAADGTLKRAPKSKKASKKASTKASATGAGAGVGAGAASTKKKKKASTKPKQAEKHPDGADNAYASFTLPRGADTATAAGGAGTNATESTKKKASTKKSKKKSTKSKANDEEEEATGFGTNGVDDYLEVTDGDGSEEEDEDGMYDLGTLN